eukprot:gene4412-8783_t
MRLPITAIGLLCATGADAFLPSPNSRSLMTGPLSALKMLPFLGNNERSTETVISSRNDRKRFELRAAPGALFACIQTKKFIGIVALLGALLIWVRNALWVPSRTYNKDSNTVGVEYDNWTKEGILEYYWGEHIHLGYYNDEERKKGYLKKNFIQAKYDFIDKMMEFGEVKSMGQPPKILDVGCGIGGTSRYLAKAFGTATQVTGITLSPNQ